MAVASISPAGLAAAIRIDPPVDVELSNLVDRLIAVSVAFCSEFSGPNTPVEIQDQSVILMSGYIFDSPESPPGTQWAGAFRNCGAMALLSPWKRRRAGGLVAPSGVVASTLRDIQTPSKQTRNDSGSGAARSKYISWPKTGRKVWEMAGLTSWTGQDDA